MKNYEVDPLTFAVLLPVLWAAHNVGDHIAQTDHAAVYKAKDWEAMGEHVRSYQQTQAMFVGVVRKLTKIKINRWAGLVGAVFSAGSHALIDRRWPVQLLLEKTGSPRFAKMQTPINGSYQADQALHHACLVVTALIMATRRTT